LTLALIGVPPHGDQMNLRRAAASQQSARSAATHAAEKQAEGIPAPAGVRRLSLVTVATSEAVAGQADWRTWP